jgi:ABC-type multidrug transport system fused ATPase/permease subunit
VKRPATTAGPAQATGILGDFWEQFRPRTHADPELAQVLDRDTEIDARQTISLLARALRYVGPVWWRFAAKALFAIVGLAPAFLYPWTLSILVDHVIRAEPVDATSAKYPWFLDPVMQMAVGLTPFEILAWVIACALVLVVLVGGFMPGAASNATTDVRMAGGWDAATSHENIANQAMAGNGGLYGFVEYRWQLRLSQALNHHYRSQIYEKIQSFPMKLLDNQRIGDTIFRVVYDTPMLTGICYQFATTLFSSLAIVVVVFYILATTFSGLPWLPWLAAAQVPVQLLITLPLAAHVRRRHTMNRAAGAATTATMEEGMNNMLAVQSLGGERRQQALFEHRSRESFRRTRGVLGANALIYVVTGAVGLAFTLLAGWMMIEAVIDGRISAGNYGAVAYYYGWVAATIGGFGRIWIDMQDNAAGVRRVFALLDIPGEEDDGAPLPPVREGVRIEDVDFVYPDGRQALAGVSLEGRIGEVVAIVGSTGSGKTTLASLIPRFHEPARGRVTIDGVDIAGVSLSSLRAQVTYVFQETHLFTGTIEDNIRYGNPEASHEQVVEAARIAGADDFVAGLPDGYLTRVGRGGSTLSVGQKQRLSLARALLVDAPILILDEPTSALDPETEARLVATLDAAARHKLVFVIAHRISTIRNASRIVLLEGGRVRETGTHDALMAIPGGAYRAFVEHQLGSGGRTA